jgi:carboxypeptidase Taq
LAAQLWHALPHRSGRIVDNQIDAGEFGALRRVAARQTSTGHGRKFDSRELLRRATGEELSVETVSRVLGRQSCSTPGC